MQTPSAQISVFENALRNLEIVRFPKMSVTAVTYLQSQFCMRTKNLTAKADCDEAYVHLYQATTPLPQIQYVIFCIKK